MPKTLPNKIFTWKDLEEDVLFKEQPNKPYKNAVLIEYRMEDKHELLEFLASCGSTHFPEGEKEFTTSLEGSPITVFPEEGRFIILQVGLHHICQHFMPSGFPAHMREPVFSWRHREARFGTLHALTDKKYDVLCGDLKKGVLLTHAQCQYYDDNFVVWIHERREKEGEP